MKQTREGGHSCYLRRCGVAYGIRRQAAAQYHGKNSKKRIAETISVLGQRACLTNQWRDARYGVMMYERIFADYAGVSVHQ